MKKILIASILGIAASAAPAFADGYIFMQNYSVAYGYPVYSGITYYSGPKAGQYVGSEFSVDLLYQFGTMPSFVLATGSQVSIFPGAVDGGSPLTDGAGVFIGPAVTIPGYSGGPIDFRVRAFDGASFDTSLTAFVSPVFTISSLQTNPITPPGDILDYDGTAIRGFLWVVPEPGFLAFAGLGAAAATLLYRRRRNG